MTDKQKEAIERLKYINMAYDCNNYYSRYDLDCIETALNLIQTQQAEIEESINTKDLYYENKELRKLLKKKDKEKELIYDFLYKFGSKFSGSFMKALSEDGFDIKKCENCEYETCDCKECIKQYFERKVENGN